MPAEGKLFEFGALVVILDCRLVVLARYLGFEVGMAEVVAGVEGGKLLAGEEERRALLWNGQMCGGVNDDVLEIVRDKNVPPRFMARAMEEGGGCDE